MAIGPPRTHAGISIAISRDPSLVRTVRLVAAAVARRASSSESLVEEVRLAVGEACAVMVSGLVGGSDSTADTKIRLQMDIADRLFATLICLTGDPVEPPEESMDPWALLRGLTEDLVVTQNGESTSLAMSWPL